MQLTGRCLIAFMFITLLKFEISFFQVSIIQLILYFENIYSYCISIYLFIFYILACSRHFGNYNDGISVYWL